MIKLSNLIYPLCLVILTILCVNLLLKQNIEIEKNKKLKNKIDSFSIALKTFTADKKNNKIVLKKQTEIIAFNTLAIKFFIKKQIKKNIIEKNKKKLKIKELPK